jgi:hypothetical protein
MWLDEAKMLLVEYIEMMLGAGVCAKLRASG